MKTASCPSLHTLARAGVLFAVAGSLSFAASTPSSEQAARKGKTRANESVRAGTATAPDGQPALTSIDRKWDNKSGIGTLNEAAATPDGRISTREANLKRNPDGSITTRGTFTDFDGRSFNYTETAKGTGANQPVKGTMVDVDGKISTYETTFAKVADGQTKRTTVIHHADGTKETRIELLAPPRVATV